MPKFGSVQFYKLIILTTLALCVLVPLSSAVVLTVQNIQLRRTLEARIADGQALKAEVAELAAERRQLDRYSVDFRSIHPDFKAPVSIRQNAGMSGESLAAGESVAATESLAAGESVAAGAPGDGKIVYLSIDDGPSVETGRILDVLEAEGVPATFFLVGRNVRERPGEAQAIASRGHSIGLHSDSHDYAGIYASVDSMLDDFNTAFLTIGAEIGRFPGILRFPGGSINPYNAVNHQIMISELLRRGFRYYDWNIDDGGLVAGATTDQVVRNVISGVKKAKDPRIVLMHDIGLPVTANALPHIIRGLKAEGYAFAPLDSSGSPIVFAYRH